MLLSLVVATRPAVHPARVESVTNKLACCRIRDSDRQGPMRPSSNGNPCRRVAHGRDRAVGLLASTAWLKIGTGDHPERAEMRCSEAASRRGDDDDNDCMCLSSMWISSASGVQARHADSSRDEGRSGWRLPPRQPASASCAGRANKRKHPRKGIARTGLRQDHDNVFKKQCEPIAKAGQWVITLFGTYP